MGSRQPVAYALLGGGLVVVHLVGLKPAGLNKRFDLLVESRQGCGDHGFQVAAFGLDDVRQRFAVRQPGSQVFLAETGLLFNRGRYARLSATATKVAMCEHRAYRHGRQQNNGCHRRDECSNSGSHVASFRKRWPFRGQHNVYERQCWGGLWTHDARRVRVPCIFRRCAGRYPPLGCANR